MSRAPALAALAAAVLFVPAATAASPPGLPTVTTPAVTTPTLPTPTVPTPTVTTPPVTTPIVTVPPVTVTTPRAPSPPPVKTPTVPSPAPTQIPPQTRPQTVTSTQPPAPSTAPTPPGAAVGSTSGGSASYGSSGSSPAVVGAAHRARKRSAVPLAVSVFRLARPAIVRVTVWQEAPRCRLFGRFTFAGGRGTNALRLPRRIAKHRLVVGRYRLVGTVGSRNVIEERVRVERAKGRLRVRKSHVEDGCIPSSEATLSGAGLLSLPGVAHRGGRSSAPRSGVRGASKGLNAPTAASAPRSGKALPQLSAAVQRTLIFVLLALAIALLAVSSLPTRTLRGGSAAALAQHRAALTSAGLALLAAAALALALT